ncbi:hypothetical protein R3P38DRAFT_2771895 [Favolaschia claudopus]
MYPPSLHWSSSPSQHKKFHRIDEVTGDARQSMLFKSIVQTTQGVSIGPLEYCGNGHMVQVGKNAFLAVCKGDPRVSTYPEERVLRGLNCISSKLEVSGKRKRGRTAKENRKLDKALGTPQAGHERAGKLGVEEPEDVEVEEVKPPKRRRLNADQRLALQSIQ